LVETSGAAGSLLAAADCALADDSGANASTVAHATHPRRNRDMSGIGTLSTRLSQSRKHMVRKSTRTSPVRKCINSAIFPYRL
jgi:hypothetical protein